LTKNRFHLRLVCPKYFVLPKTVSLQLLEITPLTEHTATKTIKRNAWWWFFNLVQWEETFEETTFEMDPSQLRELLKRELLLASHLTTDSVTNSVSDSINTLFDPYFTSVLQAIQDVSKDLELVQLKLRTKEAEVEKYKTEAGAVLDLVECLHAKVCEARKHPALSGV
jgi:hypothetical protein